MDIKTLSAASTATITLRHPSSGEEMPGITVTLHGPGSTQYQQAQATRQQLAFARLTAPAGSKKADIKAERADFCAACTASIGGWDYGGDASPAAIRTAYADPALGWIGDQVEKALGDWATFLPAPSAS